MERDKDILGDAVTSGTDGGEEELFSLAPLLKPFEVTLDSILILPHWEVLDARVETLEERMPQVTVGESDEQLALRRKREEGVKLIEREVRKGKERKLEREKKRAARKRLAGGMIGEDGSVDNDENHADARSNLEDSSDITDNDEDDESDDLEEVEKKKNGYNGPCVIYLSPSDESRITLEYLRETLCEELFPMYDAFSPSSSVTPYPEQLPRKAKISNSASSIPSQEIKFRPLLPIGRFPTVDGAIKTAKVLQEVWEPLTFNVTDIQFISRNDDDSASHNSGHDTAGVGFGSSAENKNPSHWDIPEVRYRRKHGTLSSSRDTTQRLALTSAGEVEDVSNKGVYGCDAMVMLLGEEPEEDVMNEESSLAMLIMDDEDGYDGNDYVQEDDEFDDTTSSRINYDEIFTTAEREYQRMQAHEESPPSSYGENGDNGEDGEEEIRFMGSEGKGIEEWLDDDELLDDEGATVVVGRSQFFMGAMRDYVG